MFICLNMKFGTQLLYIELDSELDMLRQFVKNFKSQNKKIIDVDKVKKIQETCSRVDALFKAGGGA